MAKKKQAAKHKAATKKRAAATQTAAEKTAATRHVENLVIPLQDPDRWEVRIAPNTDDDQARIEELLEMGWRYVVAEDLAVRAQDIGFKVMDSTIVRGDRGDDGVLIKLLKVDLAAFEEADAAKKKAAFEAAEAVRHKTVSAKAPELAPAVRAPEPLRLGEQASYPATRYHASQSPRVVQSAEEDKALGPGWHDSPKKVQGAGKAHAAKAPKAAKSAPRVRAKKAHAPAAAHAHA